MLRRDCEKHKTSPFKDGILNDIDSENIFLVNRIAYSLEDAEDQTYTVQGKDCIKVKAAGVGALLHMSSSGLKIYAIILGKMFDKNRNGQIYLSYNTLDDRVKKLISRSTFTRGVTECIETGIIAETLAPNIYFFNSNYCQ